jgi:hypothetical protein
MKQQTSSAVFCCVKNKQRSIDPPCLDPLDFGIGNEPSPELLLRRGRVALFESREKAEQELEKTLKSEGAKGFREKFSFIILPCLER